MTEMPYMILDGSFREDVRRMYEYFEETGATWKDRSPRQHPREIRT